MVVSHLCGKVIGLRKDFRIEVVCPHLKFRLGRKERVRRKVCLRNLGKEILAGCRKEHRYGQ